MIIFGIYVYLPQSLVALGENYYLWSRPMKLVRVVQVQHVLLFAMIVTIIGWAGQVTHAQLDYEYAIFKVNALGDHSDDPWGTNNAGQIVGASFVDDLPIFHPFVWGIGEEAIDMGTFGGSDGKARNVNNHGVAVGFAQDQEVNRAFMWTPETEKIALGNLGGTASWAYAINDNAQICGYASTGIVQHAFIWEDGVMTDLSISFPDEWSFAWGINNHGVVVGEFRNNAAMWKDGEYIDLGPNGTAFDINDHEQVVGTGAGPSMWVDGVWYALSKSGFGKKGIAYAINNKSEVVGFTSQGPQQFAFIWTPQKGLRILDDLIPPNNFAHLISAHDIAENGNITARAWNFHGYFTLWATLLIPVKPEILLSDPIPGIAGEINRWKVSQVVPGAEVTLYYSLEGGGAIVEGCDKMDAVLQLQNPKFAQSVIANENGIAYFDIHVVNKASNLGTILIQAIDENNCQESQLQVVEF